MKKRKLLLLALAAVFATSVFSGCGTDSATNKNEMVIKATFGNEPETLDPGKATGVPEATYLGELFEGLTSLDKDGQPVAAAADKWDVSEDGLTYTFHLRDSKWSNGDPVTAADFEFAWKRTLSPELASEYAYMLYPVKGAEEYNKNGGSADNVGVKAIDDKTLEVKLANPTAYFLSICSHQSAFPVNKKIVEADKEWASNPEKLIGNGPFKLQSWEHNSKLTVVKNDVYWDKDNVKVSRIEMPLLDNMSTATSMFDNGELDLVLDPPVTDVDRLKKEGKVVMEKNVGTYYYELNTKMAPFDNPKVRKAFALALNREELVKNVLHGTKTPAYAWIPNGFTDPTTKKDFREEAGDLFKENIAEAKQLLTEAGYPDGQGLPPITLLYNTNENHKAIAETVQEMWKKNLGVNVEIQNQEWKVYLQTRKTHQAQIARAGWSGDYLDPMTFADYLLSNGTNNYGQYGNPKYDELIKKAQTSGDQTLRMQAMHDAEKIAIDDMGVLPIYFYVDAVALNPKLKGVIDPGNAVFNFKTAFIDK